MNPPHGVNMSGCTVAAVMSTLLESVSVAFRGFPGGFSASESRKVSFEGATRSAGAAVGASRTSKRQLMVTTAAHKNELTDSQARQRLSDVFIANRSLRVTRSRIV